MPSFTTRRQVRVTAEEMFAVVADVERYPEFVPLCTGMTLLSRRSTADGEELIARMSAGYKFIRETFTTRVVTHVGDGDIEVSYLDGPFKHLDNRWRFTNVPGGCIVDFYIDYEFRSKMLAMFVGSKSDAAMRKIAQAFEARALRIHEARRPMQRRV